MCHLLSAPVRCCSTSCHHSKRRVAAQAVVATCESRLMLMMTTRMTQGHAPTAACCLTAPTVLSGTPQYRCCGQFNTVEQLQGGTDFWFSILSFPTFSLLYLACTLRGTPTAQAQRSGCSGALGSSGLRSRVFLFGPVLACDNYLPTVFLKFFQVFCTVLPVLGPPSTTVVLA